MGSTEEDFQSEYERNCCAAAQGEEEDSKGRLIAFSAEYNRLRNQIQRSAARKSREGTSIILTRCVSEC